ncbi:E3 ubiquitin-protein ligase DTX3L [Mastacembelus armatus]|uniref:E3 ubiquitin-protein ligase DTX3L n=1 Tax=Mastacembelus armatus TaxID=205130 RepID=UPI000E458BBB|nr:E3 ubiquitin-protein ligase DTX3L-like [Mastacembelus armatus]
MAFITDINVIIDEAEYKDSGRLMNIVQPYGPEKKGSCYILEVTYEELNDLSQKLFAEKHGSSPASKLPSTDSKSLDVSAVVMTYIQQKCTKELHKIQGNAFVIETLAELRTVHSCSTVQVILRPRHGSICPVHADLVKQRFITFYQRTASDLQVTSVPSHYQKHLQRRFPLLLFEPGSNKYELTVTGPFGHVAKLKEFVLQNLKKGPTDTPSTRISGPSPTHIKNSEDESCPICMERIVTPEKTTLRCKHSFCRACLKKAFDYKPVCPICGELYGILTGTQPDGGRMNVTTDISFHLPGYDKYGTIIIQYYIPGGIQKDEHPNPGQPYEGISRTAYLPDSSEGKRIVKLLRRAFDQKLIFTVGRSTTTGRNNMVTWNDIHHKTSTHGGPTHYGYPDPDYLSRVQNELKFKGIE